MVVRATSQDEDPDKAQLKPGLGRRAQRDRGALLAELDDALRLHLALSKAPQAGQHQMRRALADFTELAASSEASGGSPDRTWDRGKLRGC